jgi:hypothetical protein
VTARTGPKAADPPAVPQPAQRVAIETNRDNLTGQRRSVQPNQVLFPINDAGVQENHCSRFLYSFAISVRTYI